MNFRSLQAILTAWPALSIRLVMGFFRENKFDRGEKVFTRERLGQYPVHARGGGGLFDAGLDIRRQPDDRGEPL